MIVNMADPNKMPHSVHFYILSVSILFNKYSIYNCKAKLDYYVIYVNYV